MLASIRGTWKVGLIAAAGLVAGCFGNTVGEIDAEAPATIAEPAPETPVAVADAGSEPPPEEAPIRNPNELDHARLFHCPTPTPGSTPERVLRLTADKFWIRWHANNRSSPYVSSGEFRFTTDARDARMDDATAEQLVEKALVLGVAQNSRRISWDGCMSRTKLEATNGVPSRACLEKFLLTYLKRAWQRPPTAAEITDYADFAEQMIAQYGAEPGIELTAARPYAAHQFFLRMELADGPLDADGRVRLDSWQTANVVAGAVTDDVLVSNYGTPHRDPVLRPLLDTLRLAAEEDQLQTREQVQAHVDALLTAQLAVGKSGEIVLPANVRRFFREYFGHPGAAFAFKSGGIPADMARNALNEFYKPEGFEMAADATIAQLFAVDQDFIARLLSTDEFYMFGTDRQLAHWPYNFDVPQSGWVKMPPGQRAGLLTHPGWLVTHSSNQHTDPHPVHRGKWIRENLLCGFIPDLPIGVDAQLPGNMPDKSVRHRLESITNPAVDPKNAYCWSCHQLMDPLGIPFERFSHYGRWRTEEVVEDGSTVPVDASTILVATGDPALDGVTVGDAVEMMQLFSKSTRVEECFIRHTFRYYVGRDETYEDACTLVEMRDAYRASGGSFKQMLSTLLTHDTFLTRRAAASTGETP